jgi:murein L,D-transpeptidase YcbB/YkuD
VRSRFFAAFALAVALGTAFAAANAAIASEVADLLRERVEAIRTGEITRIEGAGLVGIPALCEFYERRGFAPAWTEEKPEQLIRAVRESEADGLDPQDYLLAALEDMNRRTTGGSAEAATLADRDLLFTESLIRLGYHLLFGIVDPMELDPVSNYTRTIHDLDPPAALERLMSDADIAAVIEREKPSHPAYRGLKAELAAFRALKERGGWESVPAGATLRPGDTDPRVAAVRTRLAATGDFPAGAPADSAGAADGHDVALTEDTYDEALADAVRAFQSRHGLEADGVIGPRTLEEMNTPVDRRIDQVRVNLERARWLLHDIGGTFVIVNVAGFRLYVVHDGEVRWQTRVQVGKMARKTPVFRSELTYLVLNPTWTVPPLLRDEDILPKQRSDPSTLSRMKIKVLTGDGKVVDPSTIDWSRSWGRKFPYILRQEAGPGNALGRVKFMFPNEFAVYLHDTPDQALFEKEERAFSSGCIRVEDPLRLAELLLEPQEGWTREEIERVIATGKTRSVTLAEPVPVLLAYWTTWNENGVFQFRRDLYGRDSRVLAALEEPFQIR